LSVVPGKLIFTIGHSNKPLDHFLSLVRSHGVLRILDVRRHPGSRRWPHFGAERLARSLGEAGVDYAGLPELGGRREPREGSPHTAWRVAAFRGYADYMDTPDFAAGLARAEDLASEKRSALLCAEALPWRCHRSLIADAFVARGWEARDILSESEARVHALPDFARVEGGKLVYDGEAGPR
jgi:uncharacterized protein (DUF488 family)